MADNVNIIVQDTINDIVVNAAVVVETIDINVQTNVDEVQIIANPNNYVVNINRIIGEQVQSDWTQTDNQAPDYIKNKPTIPAAQVNSDWDATTGVAEILNKPTIPAAQVNSDWNATSGLAQILNKPTLATVATSGSYTDLINKPTIPAAVTKTSDLINDGENGVDPFITAADIPPVTGFVPYTGATANVDLGTHTLSAKDLVINHSSGSGVAASITKGGAGEALTINKTSGSGNAMSVTGGVTQLDELHLTTDLADSYIASAVTWNGKQDALVSGTNIKTINGNSVLGSGDLVVSGSNIYNANGTLTGNRTVTSGGFTLTFTSNIQTGLLGVNRAFASNVGLYLKGSGTTSTTFNLLGTDSAGNNLYTFLDDGTLLLGSVGKIGTSKLQVTSGNISILGTGNFYELNNPSGAGIKNNSGDFYIDAIAASANTYFRNGSSPTERMRIVGSTGNILINTTTDAGFKLDVKGTARVQGAFRVADALGTTNINGAGMLTTRAGGAYFGQTVANSTFRITSDIHELYNKDNSIQFENTTSNGKIIGTGIKNASAKLQVESITQGFLPPRMTTTEKNAISTPAAGLMVYDTTLNLISVYNGTIWISL